jgi:hypothetical protein
MALRSGRRLTGGSPCQIFLTGVQHKGSIFRLSERCSYLTNCTLS